jgi:membrane protease YdiL (CAAX protease family)
VRLARTAELALIFGGAPLLLLAAGERLHPILVVVVVAGVITALLLRDREFDRASLWRSNALRGHCKELLLSFAVTAALIAVLLAWLDPEKLFWLPRHRPVLWAVVMVAYPVLSVYPQELIYRAFFFHRYRPLFGQGRGMILASATAFGFMHLLFRNWIAVLLTLAGGLVFARRYRASRSLLLTSLEHALYGQWIFTVGLGEYFFAGTLSLAGEAFPAFAP